MSAKNKKNFEIKEDLVEEAVITPVEEGTDDSPVEEAPIPVVKPVIGTVSKCPKLNVRKKPNLNAKVVTVIGVNCKVNIDEDKSTNDFYKVTTESGVEGYCMKDFIVINA